MALRRSKSCVGPSRSQAQPATMLRMPAPRVRKLPTKPGRHDQVQGVHVADPSRRRECVPSTSDLSTSTSTAIRQRHVQGPRVACSGNKGRSTQEATAAQGPA